MGKEDGKKELNLKAIGVIDLTEMYEIIRTCNEKKICILCYNPCFVVGAPTNNVDYSVELEKEININLFVCTNCLNKIAFFKDIFLKLIANYKSITLEDIYS